MDSTHAIFTIFKLWRRRIDIGFLPEVFGKEGCMKPITPLPEKWIIEFGKHLDDLVRIAKEVGSYCNSDPGDEREVAHRELHRLYEGFCEWRHDKPYGTTDFSELLSQLLPQSYEQGKKEMGEKIRRMATEYGIDKRFIHEFDALIKGGSL